MHSCFYLSRFKMLLVVIVCSLITQKVKATPSIEQLKFKDAALTNCIQKLAQDNHWQAIDDIRQLKCHGMHIQSLEGLKKLSNLTSLSLYNNKLENIDLRTFKQLEHVNIANNKLHAIKLGGLTQLKTLYLFKNKLTKLNFIGLSQLQKIRITNNQLVSLDISPLISLEKAYFFDNKLEDLVLTGLPQLKFVEVRQNPMPDEVYDRYDALDGITIIHDGNADDWK